MRALRPLASSELAESAGTWHYRTVIFPSARPTARRALVAAVVALCVAGQLTSAAHFVMVRHSFCALHGEAVDLDTSHAATAPRRGMGTGHVESISGSHDDSALDEHNHCAIAVDRVSRLALPPATAVDIPPALLVEVAHRPASAERIAGAGLLLLAPKTSPPA